MKHLLAIIFLATACIITNAANYSSTIVGATPTDDISYKIDNIKTGEGKKAIITPTYTDSLISISFNVLKDRIDYTLQNKTKEQIVINWLQSAFIGPDGISKSLFINTKLLKSLVLSTNAYIPPFGTVTDAFIPAENVEIQLFGFRVKDLFSKNKEKTITYRVFLSLFINNKPASYYFDFEGKKK